MKLHRKISVKGYTIDLVLLTLTLKITASFVGLGLWQLSRLDEKNTLLEKIVLNLNSEPKQLSEIQTEDIKYSKVKIDGKFLEGNDIFLYGRRSGTQEKDGYYLVSPFQTVDKEIVMVARGWFSHSNKSLIDSATNHHHNLQSIVGITMPSETRKMLVPENDLLNRIWFTLDLAQVSKVMGREVEDFYVIKTGTPEFNLLRPIPEEILLKVRNDHKEYAITWFSLSIALAIMFCVYTIKISK